MANSTNNTSANPIWVHPAIVLPFYLVLVNLACGLIAVEFRYPSLWGGSNIFEEYAYPLPLSRAMAHLPSMGMMSVILYRMPSFSEGSLTKTRRGILIALTLCIALEFVLGGGKFAQTPFLLFFIVDLSAAYFFTLLLHQPHKPLVAILLALIAALILAAPKLRFQYEKYRYDQKVKLSIEREAERARKIKK